MTANQNDVKLYVKLNRDGSKVKLNSKANISLIVAKIITFGFPLLFINYKYGLISFQNREYSITGWTMAGGIIVYLALQNSIREWVNKNKEDLATYKRAKWVGVWLSSALIVWIGSVFLVALVQLFLVSALGVASSLPFWRVYDTAIEQKDKLQPELDKEQTTKDLDQLKVLRLQKVNKKKSI